MSLRTPSMLALILAFGSATAAPSVTVPLRFPSGARLQAELMVSDQERSMGLMFRPSLPKDHALLFVFEDADFHGIWMKNCRFPIDIVWLDEAHEVVHLAARVPPCRREPCAVYQPMRRAAYVIEMNAGEAQRDKLRLGSRVEFTLPR